MFGYARYVIMIFMAVNQSSQSFVIRTLNGIILAVLEKLHLQKWLNGSVEAVLLLLIILTRYVCRLSVHWFFFKFIKVNEELIIST